MLTNRARQLLSAPSARACAYASRYVPQLLIYTFDAYSY